VCAVIERIVEAISRTRKQQALAVRIFGDRADVGQRMFWKISAYRFPGFSKVIGLVDEGIPVVHQMKIDADVRRGGIKGRRSNSYVPGGSRSNK
jgi:hypothetical protein